MNKPETIDEKIVTRELYSKLEYVEEMCKDMRFILNGKEYLRLKYPLGKIKSYVDNIEIDVSVLNG